MLHSRQLFSHHRVDMLRNVKIRYRLLCVFLLLSLLPVTFVGVFAYRAYTDSIHRKLQQSTEQAVYLLNQNLLAELNKFRDYIGALSVTNGLQGILSSTDRSIFVPTEDIVLTIREISLIIPFQSIYLKNMRVLDRNKNIIYDLGYDDIAPEALDSIMKTIDNSSPKDSLQYIKTYRGTDKIALGRKIFDVNAHQNHIGYILVYIDEKLVGDVLFDNVSFGEGSNLLLMDNKGNVISSQNKALLGSMQADDTIFSRILSTHSKHSISFNADINNIPHLIIANYNPELEFYMVATIPYEYITSETRQINISLICISTLLIILSLAATLIVYTSIMRPINNMIGMCNIQSDEDLDKELGDTSPDELGFLSRTIDNMLREMKALGAQWNKDQMMKRQLELEMLQYQINPHFLFNTLNSLKFVAQMNDVPILDEGISSLSSLLQHTLVRKQELIPISMEIDNLKHYFNLQNIRYAGMFTVVYELEDITLKYEIPRFVLQPLAENSIIHGTIKNKEITITIISRLLEDSYIEITLKDNGSGFDPSTLELGKKERFSSIGLSNVDQRIKLHYGSRYGLTISSTPGEGTLCRLLLPQHIWKEDTENVSGIPY